MTITLVICTEWLRMRRSLPNIVIAVVALLSVANARAADWPMWRNDAQRTATSSEQLPGELGLLWTREFEPLRQAWDDTLNLDLMTYDRVFEPIVMDGKLLVGFNDRDKLVAFEAATGRELWSFYAEGPVRLPPAGWNGRVYFCSDDGFLYCVNAADGRLEWRFRGVPSLQHAIGNQRLTSAWPARGGPVVRDGTVYFAASIWPFMGTFIYALDAESGEVQWVNDSTGSQYIKQPHSAPSFAGVAPQGALVATETLLLVPGGRSVPAVFHRKDGTLRYFEINAGGKGTGGSFVVADQKHFYVHTRQKGTRAFNINNGVKTDFMPNEPVLANGFVVAAAIENERNIIRAYGEDHQPLWQVAADGSGDLILAGDHLYAAGKESITAIRLPDENESARVIWSIPVAGQVERLLAADSKLFAVTLEGAILAFGRLEISVRPDQPDVLIHPKDQQELPSSQDSTRVISNLLTTADAEGYAFWFGASDGKLIDALAANSPFVQLAIVDDDRSAVHRLRQRLDSAGLYGRVTAHHSDAHSFMAPKLVANVIFIGRNLSESADEKLLATLYESVRPYGGVMHLLADGKRGEIAAAVEAMELEQAQVEITDYGVLVRRVGALTGSADWTHQYGDVANTIKSNDRRVKLPLGVLWFGGNSNEDVLPRHGHGPPEQVVGGRLFIQGMNTLSARDVYTGRVLWKREFSDLETFDVYYDATYRNTPLDPRYNQDHIPGANARGTNFVVTHDRVYMVEGGACRALDPKTGQTLQDIELPADKSGNRKQWGYIGVYEDVLIGGLGFANYVTRNNLSFAEEKKLTGNRAGFGSKSLDHAASVALVGFDRHTGEQLWRVDANHSFWHNGIVAGGGRIYCLDRYPKRIEDALRRRGKSPPGNYRIVAFDFRSGELQWEITEGIFGTWLGYSAAKDLLLQAGAAASDRLMDEVGSGMAVYSGTDGALRWKNETIQYAGPCILYNDWIMTNANSYEESAGAFRLEDGEQKLVPHPLTGEMQPWKITRTYGCNNIVASEHLLTFRSGAAGFFDLLHDSGTGNFGGFKSGCTSNLVVANGVLNAPDYTRTCSCAYQNQTSLAMVHMPELELWTINSAAAVKSKDQRIRKLGINFGAPGDRRDSRGLLWLEYPVVAGPSPPLSVDWNSDVRLFCHHTASMAGCELPWVLSSGLEGATEIRIGLTLGEEFHLSTGIPVSHPDDDAEENEEGKVHLGSSDLELVEDAGSQLVGLRFNHIHLSRNAVVRKAFIQFTCDETSSGPTSLFVNAEKTGNAQRFSSDSHDLSRRPRTAAEVAWSPDPWNEEGASADVHLTPDLAPLIREVTSHPDWKPGNSLGFLIGGVGKRVAVARGDDDQGAAKLIVDADEVTGAVSGTSVKLYQVRMFFGAPETAGVGRCVFDVYLQDQLVVSNVELDPAGSPDAAFAIHTFDDVKIADHLRIRFAPTEGKPLLSGIEFVCTQDDR